MVEHGSSLPGLLSERYAVEETVGRGGMATVYRTRDVRHDRDVAVKILDPELSRTLGPERFLREIRIAAQLTHAHILALHDSGEVDGMLYYVMPFLEGGSLRDRLKRDEQLPVDEGLRITCEIASALRTQLRRRPAAFAAAALYPLVQHHLESFLADVAARPIPTARAQRHATT